jgi:hypothetical protein
MTARRHGLDGDPLVLSADDILAALLRFQGHLAARDHCRLQLAYAPRQVIELGGRHTPTQLPLKPGKRFAERLNYLYLHERHSVPRICFQEAAAATIFVSSDATGNCICNFNPQTAPLSILNRLS